MTFEFNQAVRQFGLEIFKAIGQEQPSAFNKNYWAGRIMAWSIQQAQLKVNLFRLVDVLPSLQTNAAIAAHAQEYLANIIGQTPGLLGGGLIEWGLKGKAHSLRAKLLAYVIMRSVKEMASMFIVGENPQRSLKGLKRIRDQGLAFTVDLLGEFAVSEKEAEVYLERYLEALNILSQSIPSWNSSRPIIASHPGESSPLCISVKLTALYSQCQPLNFGASVRILSERLSKIAVLAKEKKALLYVDAEDSANNPIIYQVFKKVFASPQFIDFPFPGIVVQAYARESKSIILDLLEFAKKRGAPIAVRLVKGAYWDSETISSQQQHWSSPLFAIKESTDANFEELSRILIDNHLHFLPAFGSHNVRSLAHACCYAREKGLDSKSFELQMLYGMAEPIALAFAKQGYLVRLYAPLGNMLVGMGYLVRRLLENTSNESFLRHTFYDSKTVEGLLTAPAMRE